jgi:hypothetical protein
MIWPRGFVAAASFWNYNSSADPSSDSFVQNINRVNDQLQERGALVCPTNCSCDYLTACGKPYLKPTPPKEGDALTMAVWSQADLAGCSSECLGACSLTMLACRRATIAWKQPKRLCWTMLPNASAWRATPAFASVLAVKMYVSRSVSPAYCKGGMTQTYPNMSIPY